MLSLAARLAAARTDEDAVWAVYSGTEKLIAILRFRLDYETPGVFATLPEASDPGKLLGDAEALLSKSAEEIREGRLVDSVETLRKARNNLRSFLTELRTSATRAERKLRRRSKKSAGRD